MTSLAESQAFLDQFDKCLPLCERGDAVTVINALHTLNSITKASIQQAIELDAASGKDFACTFLIEMELALELHTAPVPRLGTIDGGLPELYSFTDEELAALSKEPSPLTKGRVRKFLTALGVQPSAAFEERSVADTVVAFLKCQVKPTSKVAVPSKPVCPGKISWADMCSSGSECDSCSDASSVPSLESDSESETGLSCRSASPVPSPPASHNGDVAMDAAELPAEEQHEGEDDDEEEFLDPESEPEECARVFLWAAPANPHDVHLEDGARGDMHAPRMRDTFHKTRLCRTFRQTGKCPFGDRCNFAHGPEEMRTTEEALALLCTAGRAPSSRRQQESSDSSDTASTCSGEGSCFGPPSAMAAHYKTRMCKIFEKQGWCKYGDRCNYAHSREEIVQRKNTRSADHKTRICKAYMRSGNCPYGDRCTFAHGREELRVNVLQF